MEPKDRYGVVGHPIRHSRSPLIHAHFAEQTNQSLTYEAFDVPPSEFANWARTFFDQGGRGLNVTIPHKEAAVTLADRLTPRAKQAGAVNTLAREVGGAILGDNTDGSGWVTDLARRGTTVQARSVLILGAGGAVRGLLGPLLDQRPAAVSLLNRTPERAHRLVQDFSAAAQRMGTRLTVIEPAQAVPTVDWIVHASALGHGTSDTETLAAWPISAVGPATIACDLSYGEAALPFCDWARVHGAGRRFDGLGMLIEQAAESFAVWRGIRPDTSALRDHWLTPT